MKTKPSLHFRTLIFLLFISLTTNAQPLTQDYIVDRTFGNTCGLSMIDPLSSPNPNELFKLSNGKYMVVGDVYDNSANAIFILFSRFNPDGTTDSTFGTNGVVKYTFNGRNDVRCALMTNDTIYVAGYESNSNAYSASRAYVARFNSDGIPDSSFNGTGRVVELNSTNPISCSFYTHLALQSDGKIIALGYEAFNINGGSNALMARRYDTNGNIDPTFHPSVIYPGLTLPTGNYFSKGIIDAQDGSMRFLYLSNINNNVITLKLDSLGEPVMSYGTSGENTTTINTPNTTTVRYFSDAQNALYAQGLITNLNQDIRLIKLDDQGNPDSTFSGDGILDAIDYPGTNLDEKGYCLHLDNSGRLWTMGNGSFAFTQPKGIIYRYDASGATDSSFEGTGYSAITEFSGTVFRNVYFESDDEFVVNTITNGLLGLLKLRLSNGVITIQNAGSDTICTGAQAVLSIDQPNACYTYQWKKDGVDFANQNDTVITVSTAGSYLVVATAGDDVISSDSIVIVEENCSSVIEVAIGNPFVLYPNPATASITLLDSHSGERFLITDVTGKTIKVIRMEAGKKEMVVSVVDLSAGVYFIKNNAGAVKSFYVTH